jgi:hypothetical protein
MVGQYAFMHGEFMADYSLLFIPRVTVMPTHNMPVGGVPIALLI